jgi:signal transduction histidine kinase
MINLFADVDVSVVCEEVVEGVFAGNVFQNVTAQSFDMVPDTRGRMSDNAMIGPQKLPHAEVAVILDMAFLDYQFTTQPGAFRRVIMNLLGNSLKYTSHGYVRITLDAVDMEDLCIPATGERISRSMLQLTVTDTGRGISSEFLRTRLFTPFAQENSLSSGTGLGLSIVRSIVQLLEGELTIDSEAGRGTRRSSSSLNFYRSDCDCRGKSDSTVIARHAEDCRIRFVDDA